MNEIEVLIKQRNEINEKIRRLKNSGIVVSGRAKLDVESYATGKPDEWSVAYKIKMLDTERKERWFPIIRGTKRSEVIFEINSVIGDLSDLRDELTKEGN